MKKIFLSIILFIMSFNAYANPVNDKFKCIIVGDSIAVGLSLADYDCKTLARLGITTKNWFETFQYNPFYRETLYKIGIISLSTNDLYNGNTEEYLYDIRKGLRADKIYWILPSKTLKPTQYEIIRKLSEEFYDTAVSIENFTRDGDGIHPNTLKDYLKIITFLMEKE